MCGLSPLYRLLEEGIVMNFQRNCKVSYFPLRQCILPTLTIVHVAASQQCYQRACHKLEEQAQLIARLMSDNATLISQVSVSVCVLD